MSCGCSSCLSGHKGQKLKIKSSLMAALLFIVIASPELFGVMQNLLGNISRVATPAGVPTAFGLVLHAAVFGLITYAMMGFKKGGGAGARRGW